MTPRRVFVVDDEPVIVRTLAEILRQNGYDATPFTSAEDAIASAKDSPPDLLLSDVVMPGMSGVELAVHFRRVHPTCRILLLSGQATTLDLLRGARSRGYDFELLAKPVHPKELLQRIMSCAPTELRAAEISERVPENSAPSTRGHHTSA